jgi:uncharacterized protein YcbX
MRIEEIRRYPVKSLGGESVESATVDERGIEGDRAWGVYDPATETVLTARREPRLLFLTARLVDGAPEITTEDGTRLPDDAALSGWIGRPVELRSATDGEVRFEAPRDDFAETDDWASWDSTAGTFHDGRSKISIVGRSSLGEWDQRRFRINLIVDADEYSLDGDVQAGTVRLAVRKPLERCVMVTRAQPGIERDLEVLKRIRRERSNQLGVGCVVTTAGSLAVGDTVIAV